MASHTFAIACECGATLGMSPGVTDVTDDAERTVIRVWEELHSGLGHERVTCVEARLIRNSANRKHYSYAWAKRNPQRVKEIQAKHRRKRRERVD